MHDYLSFSVLFLGYNPHYHDCMPSNITSTFEAGKTWRFLHQFDTLRNQTLSRLKNRVYTLEKLTIWIFYPDELLKEWPHYSLSNFKH